MNDEIQKRLEYLALVSAMTHVEIVLDEPALFEMQWDGKVVHATAPSGRVLINRLPIEPAF